MQKTIIAGNVGKDAVLRRTQGGDPVLGLLPDLLRYEQKTGFLFWLERKGIGPRDANFNSRFAGKEAFTAIKDGYRCGAIFNKNYRAHRVIFALMTRRWPEGQIDHINGIRHDNRWENLRDVSVSENQRNVAISRNNTSGHQGVYWDSRRGKWTAQISVDFKNKYIGAFDRKEDAVSARLQAEQGFGFHKNNGRAA